MNSSDELQEKNIEMSETGEDMVSFDDFIRELEEKEKDLHIVTSEIFVEIEPYEDDADNSNRAEIAGSDSGYSSHAQFSPDMTSGAASGSSLLLEQSRQEQHQLRKEMTELRQQIRHLEKERAEMRDVISRRQNDFENYRKRTERDRHETFRNLVGNVAGQMLPVIDNLNRALDSSDAASDKKSPEFQHFLDGIFMVNQQLNEVLAEMGIEPIHSVGEPFDPHLHEAAATEVNGEIPSNTITKELLRGYRLGEKIIRHAVVKVSTGGSSSARTSSPAAPSVAETETDLTPVEAAE